jgi:hypothetical protein
VVEGVHGLRLGDVVVFRTAGKLGDADNLSSPCPPALEERDGSAESGVSVTTECPLGFKYGDSLRT